MARHFFKIFLGGGTRCPQRVDKRTRLRGRIFAPSASIVAIVFGEADPPRLRLARDTRATTDPNPPTEDLTTNPAAAGPMNTFTAFRCA